jgi:hypothetical protein
MRQVLAAQSEQRGAVVAAEGSGEGGGGFFGIAGADDVEIRDHAQAADGFHRLMRRAVFTDADGRA